MIASPVLLQFRWSSSGFFSPVRPPAVSPVALETSCYDDNIIDNLAALRIDGNGVAGKQLQHSVSFLVIHFLQCRTFFFYFLVEEKSISSSS